MHHGSTPQTAVDNRIEKTGQDIANTTTSMAHSSQTHTNTRITPTIVDFIHAPAGGSTLR